MPRVSAWREAVRECEAGEFVLAEAALLRHIERTMPPLAALATVLVVYEEDVSDVACRAYEEGVGFNTMDRPEGIELGEVVSHGEPLTEDRQAYACKKLARRYALQAVKTVWGNGGRAAPERMRRLFDGRCPRTGSPLNWGDELPADAGEVDRGDSEDDDPAEEADEDFIDDADAGSIEEEEEEEAEDSDEEAEASGETGGTAQTPQAPATYRKSQSARAVFANAPMAAAASAAAGGALNARRDALHEAWEMAQAHADALKKKLSAVERQLDRQRRRAAADARAKAQAARAASRAAASPPPPLRAASGGDERGDPDELPPVPAGVLKAAAAAAPRGRRARSATPVPGLSDTKSEDSWEPGPTQRRAVKRKIAFSEDDEA
jgi:hypothetical protein